MSQKLDIHPTEDDLPVGARDMGHPGLSVSDN
jgi:hypothetical protein